MMLRFLMNRRVLGTGLIALFVALLACNGAPSSTASVSETPAEANRETVAKNGGPGPELKGSEPTGSVAGVTATSEKVEIERLELVIVRELPHSQQAYTQGLLLHEGLAFESRGQVGRSGIDVWNPEDGRIVRSVELEPELFGEGLARVDETLWQVTWQAGRAFRWSLDLDLLEERSFLGEGWGLEFDGSRLLMSDGTHELRFFDPETFEYQGKLAVMRGKRPQDQLNELEYIPASGLLFANIYQSDEIVRISLESGHVTGVADLSGLLSRAEARRADVLNGIAYWPDRDSFLVTGKHWPKSFEVKLK